MSQDGILTARAFDPKRLHDPGPGIASHRRGCLEQRSLVGCLLRVDNGQLAWLSATSTDVQLEWIDRDGKPLGTLGERGQIRTNRSLAG